MSKSKRYTIVGTVAGGENKGLRVVLYWSPEGGGWWQWTSGDCGFVFNLTHSDTNERFADAINTAYGNIWCGGPGPWFFRVDPTTVRIKEVR